MKLIKHCLLALIVILAGSFANAQMSNNAGALNPELQNTQNPPRGGGLISKMRIGLSAGIANYYGDLMQNFSMYNQSSFASGLGFSYRVFSHLNARVDLACLKVRGNDGKNTRADLRARNLSFKTVIWDLSVAAEYEVLNIDNHKFTPYLFAGFGAFYFNPYANDRYGYKQFLQPLGTEGQGLTAYPDRHKYKRVEFEIPLGGGVKWAVNKRLTIQAEYSFRHTNTDYIDDVSRLSYPDKALLDASNPRIAKLTWRGDEVGGQAYPTNPGLNRGNPKKNDVFYSTQLKFVYKLTR